MLQFVDSRETLFILYNYTENGKKVNRNKNAFSQVKFISSKRTSSILRIVMKLDNKWAVDTAFFYFPKFCMPATNFRRKDEKKSRKSTSNFSVTNIFMAMRSAIFVLWAAFGRCWHKKAKKSKFMEK